MRNSVAIGIIVLSLLLAACGRSEQESAGKNYVAYAFSSQARSGAFGFSKVSKNAARDEALAECQITSAGKKCSALGAFEAQCAAIALAKGARVTPAPGSDAQGACRAAEEACAKGGEGCASSTYACNGEVPGFCRELNFSIADADADSPAPQDVDSGEKPDEAASRLTIESNTYKGTEGPYGAISIVSSNGRVVGFVGYDEPDGETANELALGGCRKIAGAAAADCDIKLTFQNACAAIASTPDGGYGTGWGNSPAAACTWAIDACDDFNQAGCEGDMYLCSPGGRNGTCDGGIQIEGDTTTLDNGLLVVKGGQKTNGGN